MNNPLTAICLSFLITTGARADTAACLTAPTQECVFEMALEQADAEPGQLRTALGFFTVAAWQEAVGRDDYRDTFERLPGALEGAASQTDRWATPLSGSLFAWGYEPYPLVHAPQTTVLAYEFVSERGTPIDPPQELSLFASAYLGDHQAVEDLLTNAAPETRRSLATAAARGYIRSGDFQAAYALMEYAPYESFQAELDGMVFWNFLFHEPDLRSAEAMLDIMSQTSGSQKPRSWVALEYAKAGDFSNARRVISHEEFDVLTMNDVVLRSSTTPMTLGAVYARLGQSNQANAILERLERPVGSEIRYDNIRAIAALVNQNYAEVRRLFDLSERENEPARWLEHAVGAAALAGTLDLDALLSHLTPELQAEAVGALFSHQARMHDIDAAFDTLARLEALDPMSETYNGTFGRMNLVTALLEAGRPLDAVPIIHTLGIAETTAEVAAALR